LLWARPRVVVFLLFWAHTFACVAQWPGFHRPVLLSFGQTPRVCVLVP